MGIHGSVPIAMPNRDWRSYLAAGGLLAAISVLPLDHAVGQNPQQSQSQGETGGEADAAHKAEPPSATKAKGVEAAPTEQRERRAEERSKNDVKAQRRMAKAAIAQAILTFIGTIALVFTVIFTAKATRAAASAAETAEKTLTSVERAFVFLKYAYPAPVFGRVELAGRQIEAWDFHVVWENSGSTPTQHMTTYKNLLTFEGKVPDDFDFPDVVNRGQEYSRAKTFIGPRAEKDAGGLGMPVALLQRCANGELTALMWGWVEYSDIFRPNTRSRGEFCFEIVVTGDCTRPPDERTKPPFVFKSWDKHNGCESECYRGAGDEIPILEI